MFAVTGDNECIELPQHISRWPVAGEIQAINLTLTTKQGSMAALENLTFTIKPHETVSVVFLMLCWSVRIIATYNFYPLPHFRVSYFPVPSLPTMRCLRISSLTDIFLTTQSFFLKKNCSLLVCSVFWPTWNIYIAKLKYRIYCNVSRASSKLSPNY